MPLLETLQLLNSNAEPGPNNVLVHLWRQLRDDFRADASKAGHDFCTWALSNVASVILNFVNDQEFASSIQRLPKNLSRRWVAVLHHYRTSLGTLTFLFGVKVVASRFCANAVFNLSKSRPTESLFQLYDNYMHQRFTPGNGGRPDVRLFGKAIRSIDPDAWPTNKKKKKGKLSTIASEDTEATDMDMDAGSEAQHPSLFSEPPERGREAQLSPTPSPVLLSPCEMRDPDLSGKDEEVGLEQPCAVPPDEHEADNYFDDFEMSGPVGDVDDDYSSVSSVEEGNDNNCSLNGSHHTPFKFSELSTITERSVEDESMVLSQTTSTSEKQTGVDNADNPVTLKAPAPCPRLALNEDPSQIDIIFPLPFNVDARPRCRHKRSLSDTEFLSPRKGHDEPQVKPTKLPRVSMDIAPEAARPRFCVSTRRVNLQDTVQSVSTLDQGNWLNDTVIQNMSRRLESATVGVVHSLSIAAKEMTERGRLQLQKTVSKNKVLLFLNYNRNHWILFLWERDGNILTEFNSILTVPPSTLLSTTAVAPLPSDAILNFLRWVTKDAGLQLALRRQNCPQQPNGFDCGVYALAFAAKVAENKTIPATLDGSLERACTQGALLTSWDCVLRPEELIPLGQDIPCSTVERAARVQLLRVRQSSFHSLVQTYKGQPSKASAASRMQVQSLTESEWNDCQLSTLAGVILNNVAMHRRALQSALRSHEEADALAITQPLDATLRKQVKGFIAAMDACHAARPGIGEGSGLYKPKDRKLGNCLAMYANAVLAEAS